eukprot:1154210-Pelagomonas_calceolata.AAC.10
MSVVTWLWHDEGCATMHTPCCAGRGESYVVMGIVTWLWHDEGCATMHTTCCAGRGEGCDMPLCGLHSASQDSVVQGKGAG